MLRAQTGRIDWELELEDVFRGPIWTAGPLVAGSQTLTALTTFGNIRWKAEVDG